MISLGDYATDDYNVIDWIVFITASITNPIIMLNLLISIMGDTFGRV